MSLIARYMVSYEMILCPVKDLFHQLVYCIVGVKKSARKERAVNLYITKIGCGAQQILMMPVSFAQQSLITVAQVSLAQFPLHNEGHFNALNTISWGFVHHQAQLKLGGVEGDGLVGK